MTATGRTQRAEPGSGKRPMGPKRTGAERAVAGGLPCQAVGGSDCRCLPFSAGTGRHRVWGSALFSAGSVSVNLLGGDVPHVGAVAVAVPRASHAQPTQWSATTSVLALVGHKDDELARSMARALARRLAVTAVVTAGVHVRRAQPSDIATIRRNTRAAIRAILARAPSVRRQTRSGA